MYVFLLRGAARTLTVCFFLVSCDNFLDWGSVRNEWNVWMREWGVNEYTNGTGNSASLFIAAPQGVPGLASRLWIYFLDRLTPWSLNTISSRFIWHCFHRVKFGFVSQSPTLRTLGWSWNVRTCYTMGMVSRTRTRTPEARSGSVPPSLLWVFTNIVELREISPYNYLCF